MYSNRNLERNHKPLWFLLIQMKPQYIVSVMKTFDNHDWDLVFSFCYHNHILYC